MAEEQDLGERRTRVGMVQFSNEPNIEFDLTGDPDRVQGYPSTQPNTSSTSSNPISTRLIGACDF